MEESPVTPKAQGNGLLVGLLAVIVILAGVVVYMALSKPAEMPEETVSTEREETVTEAQDEVLVEDNKEEMEVITEDEELVEEDDEDMETANIDSDLQDLDEINLGNIEDEYSESTIEDLD